VTVNLAKVALKKTKKNQMLIHDSIKIIEAVGVPIDNLTPRRLEKMAMCLLALCNMEKNKGWQSISALGFSPTLTSRQVISYINKHFQEKISSGSYDDIRRKDLILLTGMGLVLKSAKNPNADTNDGTRGYALNPDFANLISTYKSNKWEQALHAFEIDQDYIDQYIGRREKKKLSITIDASIKVKLDNGPHNQIQKAIIEEFLPLYGHHAKVLYIGDTSNKHLFEYSETMKNLGMDIEDRGMLPDIVAFSEEKEWLYIIEAVHSSNPLNPERCIELQRTILKDCRYGVVFVTAFLSRKDFAKWLPQIAWETEVWLADTPEHLIHFNGDKFLGPHRQPPKLL